MKNASSDEPLEDMAHGDNLWPNVEMWNGASEFVSTRLNSLANQLIFLRRTERGRSKILVKSIGIACSDASLISAYFSYEMLALGKRIFPLLALALEMEERFFEDKVCSQRTTPLAHTITTLLLLFADQVPCRHSKITVLSST